MDPYPPSPWSGILASSRPEEREEGPSVAEDTDMPSDSSGLSAHVLLKIGELQGRMDAQGREIGELKADMHQVFNKMEDNSILLRAIASKIDHVEAISESSGTTKMLKAWDQPIGELLFSVLVVVLKWALVGILIAVVLTGMEGFLNGSATEYAPSSHDLPSPGGEAEDEAHGSSP